MADRRRINGPPSGTSIPVFTGLPSESHTSKRSRKSNQLRKIYLQTGVVPTASGSAYFELDNPIPPQQVLNVASSSLKLLCAVHGPKPLPRNSNFSSNLQLTVSAKFAPFATSQRRGYIRDANERDIGTNVESALAGVILLDRWPKSAIDIVFTILEAEDDTVVGSRAQERRALEGVAYMNIISGCITAASAALLDAQIDCLDLVTGGVAAFDPIADGNAVKIVDPSPFEELSISSVCVVAYMAARDEITMIWAKGDIPSTEDERMRGFDALLDHAISAAKAAHAVLRQVAAELGEAQVKLITGDACKS